MCKKSICRGHKKQNTRKMDPRLIEQLEKAVGKDWVLTNREAMLDYLTDETAPFVCPKPSSDVILAKPDTAQEVSTILKLANDWKIPVFPRGGGTGLVGGSVPTRKGIVLSLERMNRVTEVDEENLMITLEAGVTLERLRKAVDRVGLSFPLHPGDETAQIGGLVACNAGGARAVRYGVMSNYVKGLQVVLPTGEILTLRGKLLKDVAGYNLMHQIIGSQGTLGVITEVVLRLHPKSKEAVTLIIPYKGRHEALRTVSRILREGIVPMAIEYVDGECMEKSAKQLGKVWPVKKGRAYLIIVVSENTKQRVFIDAEKIDIIAREYDAIDTLVIENSRKQKDILSIRSNIYSTLKPYTMDILDLAVPPSNLEKLMDALDEIAEKHSIYIPMYGHAGDGNLHPHIMMKKAGGVEKRNLEKLKEEIYDVTVALGGTITAEHGVGKIRIRNLNKYLDKKQIELFREIKRIFDPNNILNPETIVRLD